MCRTPNYPENRLLFKHVNTVKYYLETNALYNLKNISDEIKSQSFTSLFAVSELISGIKPEFYHKRREILKQLYQSSIVIDHSFPQEIIFNSFDAFEDYEYIEQRDEPLSRLLEAVLRCESYEQFMDSAEYKDGHMGFDYFKKVDEYLSNHFIATTESANKLLSEEFNREPHSQLTYNDNNYPIDSKKSIEQFLIAVPEFNRGTTILAVAKMINRFTEADIPEDVLYSSYNGLINPYIEVFSRYAARKTGESGTPARNDFQDLTHILYMRSELDRKIISNDKFFKHYASDFNMIH
jgi:hypothetical protein